MSLPLDTSHDDHGAPGTRFWLERLDDKTGVSRTGRVLEGIVLPSGRVVVEWRKPYQSIAIYDSMGIFRVVHLDCHPSSNWIVWVDTIEHLPSGAWRQGDKEDW